MKAFNRVFYPVVVVLVGMIVVMMPASAGIVSSTVDQSADVIQEVSYTLPDTSAHALAADANALKRIKFIAPVNTTGAGTNTGPVFYGDATNQHDWIAADGSRDTYIHVDNPARIYVRGNAGDVIWYRKER